MSILPDQLQLRPMTEGDLDQVLAIEAEWAPIPWSLQTFKNELGVPFSRASVLHDRSRPDRVSGYLVRWLVADEMHLLSLAVEREQRGQGLGRFLIDTLLDEARVAGVDLVTLEVEKSNVPATRLYGSRGFTEVRHRRDYYGAGRDAVVMDLEPTCRVVS